MRLFRQITNNCSLFWELPMGMGYMLQQVQSNIMAVRFTHQRIYKNGVLQEGTTTQTSYLKLSPLVAMSSSPV